MSIIPQGEDVRRAVKWISEMRKDDPSGGILERLDAVGRGRVQLLREGNNEFEQAVIAVRELERLSKIAPNWDRARAAVIAREWRYLQSVRSYCEAKGIPVQAANADPPNVWRLRETQTLVTWLRDRESASIGASEISDWIEKKPMGPWWSVIREGIEDLIQDLGDRETDRKDVIEWLAEWGREVRTRQNGLLLLSAHRAKGLEFDDVVILDGGWERQSYGEDRDATRRLYYVAMTRARRSLALLSMVDRHPIIQGLDDPALLIRAQSQDPIDISDCERLYQTLNPSDVDLGYAGRLPGG